MRNFIKIVLFLVLFYYFLIYITGTAGAQTTQYYYLQVPLGTYVQADDMFQYIKVLYQFSMGIIIVLGIIMTMIGGYIWMTAAGSGQKIQNAQSYIFNSIAGILLALFSYMLLYQINPELTKLGFREEMRRVDLEALVLDDSEELDSCKSTVTKEELKKECALVEVTDPKIQTSGDVMVLLQEGAARSLNNLVNSLPDSLRPFTVTSVFRDPVKQACLASNLPNLASPMCTSTHVKGIAFDASIKQYTGDQYCEFIHIAKSNNFKVNGTVWTANKESVIQTSTWLESLEKCKNILPDNWKDYKEIWHFTWQGSAINSFSELCPDLELYDPITKKTLDSDEICP